MESVSQFLCAIIFLGLISQGNCQCFVENIEIKQSATGVRVSGKPEWNVTLTNNCICSQTNVKLDCTGFKTVEAPTPSSSVAVSGDLCLILPEHSTFYGHDSISFTYAWDTPFSFKPQSSQPQCS